MLASDLPAWIVRSFAFVFGSLWGSFFNVAIYRWPRDLSVVSPPSHCPACGARIPPYRNVPILGFLVLRGRAACCGAKMSPRYLLVEILGGVLCLALAERLIVRAGPEALLVHAGIETLLYFAFVGGLLVATFVDLEWMEIPDEVTLPGAALGLLTVELRNAPGAVDAAIGAGIGFLAVQVLFVWLYEHFLGRRGMGEGDSKLLLMIGAFLGTGGVAFAIFGGAVQGLAVAAFSLLTGRPLKPIRPDASSPDAVAEGELGEGSDETDEPNEHERDTGIGQLAMPYGPFLSLAALEYLFFGNEIVEAYQRLLAR